MTEIQIIDIELGKKLANNNRDLAEEMLSLLVKSLPIELSDIMRFKTHQDYVILQKAVHKLHGAVCYCGVPRLKNAVVAIEIALKQNEHAHITELLTTFENEANLVLHHAPEYLR